MAVTNLTTGLKTMVRYRDQPPAANSLDFAFEAPAVAADGIQFGSTGKEIVMIQNADAGPQTFSIASQRDEYGRAEDLAGYSLAAGEFAVLDLGADKLFRNAQGNILITMSSVNVKVAVLRCINAL
jgi:hypothetical protein